MSERMDDTMPRRRRRRMRTGGEVPVDLTASIRDFRDATAGLSNRLPLASLEQMRAGTVANPHTLVRRFLMAAKRIGLDKAWAHRHVVVWVERQVDCIWFEAHTPRRVLEVKAMEAEARDDAAEKALDCERSAVRLRARIETLEAEMALDRLNLAALQRELEDCEVGR